MIGNSLVQHMNAEVQADFISTDLAAIILDISSAAIVVSGIVNRNVFDSLNEDKQTINTHGERQHRLDIQAQDIFISYLKKSEKCKYLISEECDDIINLMNGNLQESVYSVCLDPLDGSSNIDVNVSVGSIFSIFCQQRQLIDRWNPISSGQEQRVAGYFLYGTSTMLVLSYGHGVHGFTLDVNVKEFRLTHPYISLPKTGAIYAINEGNTEDFPLQIRQYLAYCKQFDPENNLPYKSRYVGSMVADMHRTLLKGGIFLYPSTGMHTNGKLRLLYECNPMAYIIEQAGGLAIDGMRPILHIPVLNTHQTVPFIAGSYNMVKNVLNLYKNESINNHLYYSC
ncbi:class 1 fructose-bisphosphatase [Sphingobacterium rhinopitheci]|uniref:class 1 fructose-bisphosphatase n=1 Tax=Sphingobacterium rhinopitheci TaxID=2781960 RepID=UPI001F51A4DE|nr:class 1 fructose-bisphosphatase [Sphingobacterium rhinopitheci]MCI0922528.1 fructose-1,6-bisphosphatase [Sphingobacterium rhinopitheci]